MQARNSTQTYGWVSLLLHWLMAVAFIGMYFLGSYMVDLTYYDSLYHTLPPIHKATGILIGLLMLMRFAWVYSQPRPTPAVSTAPAVTHLLAKLGHLSLYGLVLILLISGYLISTAKGHGIGVFGWFEVPALLASDTDRADWAGDIHEIAANAFVLLIGVHAIAALAHHFYWKDNTLTRMLGKS